MEELLDTFYTTPYGDFAIKKTRFGVHTSYDREGVGLVTGLEWIDVFEATPYHLRWVKEGYNPPDGVEQVTYDSVVSGKL
jgi:hypothetical protein